MLTSLKTIQDSTDSMTRVIAAYMVNKIGIGPQLINVQLSQSSIYDITSSHHLSMVDEHNVPINLCPQNKICISQENPFHKKS